MPRDKDLKRLVRVRMQKTGESYTAARARIVSKATRKTPDAALHAPDTTLHRNADGVDAAPPDRASAVEPGPSGGPEYARVAGMSDEALEAKTGCNWKTWVYALDRHRASELSHREIARLVHEKYGIEGWWAQCVTVGYERIKGLRERGQRRGGGYEASKSKTFPVPVGVLFDACALARRRRRWIPDQEVKVRTATKPRSLRLAVGDGTTAALWLVPKGEAKSSLSVQHLNLPDRASAERSKKYWGERLDALSELLRNR